MPDAWRLKVCLVGGDAVGKTSLVRRFVFDQFDDRYITTLGAKVVKKEVRLQARGGGEATVIMTIFDIMGSPSFRDLLKEAYFQGAQGILAVWDVTRPETLPTLRGWVEAVEGVAGKVPLVLLGNKADLVDQAKVAREQLEPAVAEYECPGFLTSAKTGMNVEAAMRALPVSILGQVASGRAALESELVQG